MNSTASIRPISRLRQASRRSRGSRRRSRRPCACNGARCAAMRARNMRSSSDPWRRPATSIRRRFSRGCRSACRPTRSSPMARAIMRAGCIASIAIAAIRRCSGRRAARWAMACRRRSRRSCSIPNASWSAAAGDGCFLMNGQELATAVQYNVGDHRARVRQRHVRHHPHASGAGLSRACHRHRIAESGFRGAGPRLWRAGLRVTRTNNSRPLSRRRCARARPHPHQGRSGSDLTHDHADEIRGKATKKAQERGTRLICCHGPQTRATSRSRTL